MKIPILFFTLLFTLNLHAQHQLQENEEELKALFDHLLLTQDDQVKKTTCDSIQLILKETLKKEGSFIYPFQQLGKLGKLTSSDQQLRIYSWNIVLNDGSFQYFSLLQKKEKKAVRVFELKDIMEENPPVKYTATNWWGCLYYQIIPFQQKKETKYVLFGWDGNSITTNKKIIEVLSFDRTGAPVFGFPVFENKGRYKNRLLFEYAKQARMSIKYFEKDKKIVYDHLSPSSSQYRNQFEYYGPDFSFDALILKKGKWVLKENIDIRNKKKRR
jgi:hypothetical protein